VEGGGAPGAPAAGVTLVGVSSGALFGSLDASNKTKPDGSTTRNLPGSYFSVRPLESSEA